MPHRCVRLVLVVIAAGLASAGAGRAAAQVAPAPAALPGPPPPTLPETIARDDAGPRHRARGARSRRPCASTDRLDEAAYASVQPVVRLHPDGADGGQPASEKTEVWVFFDDDNLYVSVPRVGEPARPHDRQRDAARQRQHPPGRLRRVRASTPSAIAATPSCSKPTRSAPAPTARAPTSGSSTPTGTRSGTLTAGTLRGRLDDRGRHAVQVDPLRARHRAGLGIPGPPHQQVEERDLRT